MTKNENNQEQPIKEAIKEDRGVPKFLKSKVGNLIVVKIPEWGRKGRKPNYFSGVIIYADESKTNTAPYASTDFREDAFEEISKEQIQIRILEQQK